MLDFLFGEGQYGLRFLFAFIVVLGLIGLTAWLVRRFGAAHLGATAARGRQPRLAVIDAAAVDGRRRLVLIRRDNVEHLLMIGGPSDVVIEPNIVRAGAPVRDVPARQPAAADTLPRPVPLGEPDTWPALATALGQAQGGDPEAFLGRLGPLLVRGGGIDVALATACNDAQRRMTPAEVSQLTSRWGRKTGGRPKRPGTSSTTSPQQPALA